MFDSKMFTYWYTISETFTKSAKGNWIVELKVPPKKISYINIKK